MIKFLKFLGVSVIIAAMISISEMWYNMFLIGRYYEHATFFATAMVGFIIPLAVIYFAYLSIKSIVKL